MKRCRAEEHRHNEEEFQQWHIAEVWTGSMPGCQHLLAFALLSAIPSPGYDHKPDGSGAQLSLWTHACSLLLSLCRHGHLSGHRDAEASKYLNVTNLTKFRTRPFFAHFVRNNSALLFSSLVSSARQEAAEQHRQPSWLAGRGQQLPGQSCAVRPVHELRNVVPVDVVA